MGSLFEIHRSNLEWLKSYVCPDGFKLDFDTFRAYAHAMEIMTRDGVEYLLLAEDMDAINDGYYKFEREEDGTVSLYSHTPILPAFCEKSAVLQYLRLLPKARL